MFYACPHQNRVGHDRPRVSAIFSAHGLEEPARQPTHKATNLSDKQPKKCPTHRVSFGRNIIDANGEEKLTTTREIGAVWPKTNGKESYIGLDIIPVELTRHQGVLFFDEIPAESAVVAVIVLLGRVNAREAGRRLGS